MIQVHQSACSRKIKSRIEWKTNESCNYRNLQVASDFWNEQRATFAMRNKWSLQQVASDFRNEEGAVFDDLFMRWITSIT